MSEVVNLSITDDELESLENGEIVTRMIGSQQVVFRPPTANTEMSGRFCNISGRTIKRLRDGGTINWTGKPGMKRITLELQSEQPAAVEIRDASDPDIEPEMQDLLDALVHAYGKDLPDFIGKVEREDGLDERMYDLFTHAENLGNAYGRTLAARGWAVVGIHDHGTGIDYEQRITVQRLSEIEPDTDAASARYEEGDEHKVEFSRLTE